MTSEPLKEVYKTPRIYVRGVFLLEGLMADASCWPTIKTGTPEYWEFEDYTDLGEEDVLLF
jgi:hypothetical protein